METERLPWACYPLPGASLPTSRAASRPDLWRASWGGLWLLLSSSGQDSMRCFDASPASGRVGINQRLTATQASARGVRRSRHDEERDGPGVGGLVGEELDPALNLGFEARVDVVGSSLVDLLAKLLGGLLGHALLDGLVSHLGGGGLLDAGLHLQQGQDLGPTLADGGDQVRGQGSPGASWRIRPESAERMMPRSRAVAMMVRAVTGSRPPVRSLPGRGRAQGHA